MATSIDKLPLKYQPLSAWAYFGYNILYAIPIIGWVFMIIFALDDSNINRRNFTRSFFVVYLVYGILTVILVSSDVIYNLLSSMR